MQDKSTANVEEILIKNGRPLAAQLSGTNHALSSFSLGERIQGGRTLLRVSNLVTADELGFLVSSCVEAAEEWKQTQRMGKQPEQTKQAKEETKTLVAFNGAGGLDLFDRLNMHMNPSVQQETTEEDKEEVFLEQGSKDKIFVRLLTNSTAEREDAPEDVLPQEVSDLVERIFVRALDCLDLEACPSLRSVLFGKETSSIAELFHTNQLQYSSREPAVNIYEAPHGHFAMHKDHHALSIVIPLSDPRQDFVGGGTAFWNQSNPVQGMDGPSLVLRPPPGTAMIWGGRVSHKGLRITEGRRVVFVASFSGPGSPSLEDVQERFSAGLGVRTILSGR